MNSEIINLWEQAIFRAFWQGGLALLGAWIICTGFRRIGPGVKCWVWRLGYLKFVTALLLVGSFGLPLLPARRVETEVVRSTAVKQEDPRALAASTGKMSRVVEPGREISATETATVPKVSGTGKVVSGGGTVLKTGDRVSPSKTSIGESSAVEGPGKTVLADETKPISIRPLVLPAIFGIWAMGVLVCLMGMVRMWVRTRGIRVSASRIVESGVVELLERLARQMRLGSTPEIRASEAVSGPLLVGIVRPAILLPPGLLEESQREHLRLALTHELAHVRRKDIFWNLMQSVVESLFFFHPLIWFFRRQPRHWQELACDGMTLRTARTTVAEYGRAILGIIERQRLEPARLAGVGVAESMNTLKKRLVAMTSLRPTTGRGMIFAALMVFVLALAGIPSWRLVARAAAPERAEAAAAEDPLASGTLTVKVVDSEGKPIEDARVRARFAEDRSRQSATGKEGVAIFKMEDAPQGFAVEVNSEGKVSAAWSWKRTDPAAKAPNQVTIKMDTAMAIGGIVTDEAGKPITDANVVLQVRKKYEDPGQRINASFVTAQTDGNGKWSYYGVPTEFDDILIGVWSHMHMEKAGFFGLGSFKDLAGLKAGTAKLTLPAGTPIHIQIVDVDGNPLPSATIGYGEDRNGSNIVPSPRANGDGIVEIGVEPGATAILTAMARGYAPQQKRMSVEKAALDVKFVLERAKPLTGKVMDGDGKPIRGATVIFDSWHGTRPFGDARVITRQDGAFTWNDAPADEVTADVLMDGFAEQRDVMMKVGNENRVTMAGPTMFSGKVVDAETGKAIEEFTFVMGIDFGGGSIVSWQRNVRNGGQGKNGEFTYSLTGSYPGWKMRVEAKGYLPADSDTIARDGKRHEFTFKLAKGKPISGTIVDAEGKPVNKANVLLIMNSARAQLVNNRQDGRFNGPSLTTKADGKFQFDPQNEKYGMTVLADEGYAQVKQEDIEKSSTIALKKWARIEGELRSGTKLLPKGGVAAYYHELNGDGKPIPSLYKYHQVTADENGKFVIERVMEDKLDIGRQVEITEHRIGFSGMQTIEVKAGETVRVKIGGNGRPVIGRMEIPQEVQKDGFVIEDASLMVNVEYPVRAEPPEDIRKGTAQEVNQWREQWLKSEEGKAYQQAYEQAREKFKTYPVVMKMDGVFRAEDVPAGTYEMSLSLSRLPTNINTVMGEVIGGVRATVTVPEIPGGVSDEPLDIGAFQMVLKKYVKAGDLAPAFSVKSLDGKEIKLEDFRDKYVVLVFWNTRDAKSIDVNAKLKTVWEAYGKNPKFAMIGLNLDGEPKGPAEYVKKENLGWIQGYIDEDHRDVYTSYELKTISSIWIIGPDGKIVASNIPAELLGDAIKNALK